MTCMVSALPVISTSPRNHAVGLYDNPQPVTFRCHTSFPTSVRQRVWTITYPDGTDKDLTYVTFAHFGDLIEVVLYEFRNELQLVANVTHYDLSVPADHIKWVGTYSCIVKKPCNRTRTASLAMLCKLREIL